MYTGGWEPLGPPAEGIVQLWDAEKAAVVARADELIAGYKKAVQKKVWDVRTDEELAKALAKTEAAKEKTHRLLVKAGITRPDTMSSCARVGLANNAFDFELTGKPWDLKKVIYKANCGECSNEIKATVSPSRLCRHSLGKNEMEQDDGEVNSFGLAFLST